MEQARIAKENGVKRVALSSSGGEIAMIVSMKWLR